MFEIKKSGIRCHWIDCKISKVIRRHMYSLFASKQLAKIENKSRNSNRRRKVNWMGEWKTNKKAELN